jgi:hypothetical protein
MAEVVFWLGLPGVKDSTRKLAVMCCLITATWGRSYTLGRTRHVFAYNVCMVPYTAAACETTRKDRR